MVFNRNQEWSEMSFFCLSWILVFLSESWLFARRIWRDDYGSQGVNILWRASFHLGVFLFHQRLNKQHKVPIPIIFNHIIASFRNCCGCRFWRRNVHKTATIFGYERKGRNCFVNNPLNHRNYVHHRRNHILFESNRAFGGFSDVACVCQSYAFCFFCEFVPDVLRLGKATQEIDNQHNVERHHVCVSKNGVATDTRIRWAVTIY